MAVVVAAIAILGPSHRALSQGSEATGWSKPVFPLAVRAGKRYLEDASGKPFLIHGDTAWSLIAQLTLESAEEYLEDRRARGFNTVVVNLIERKFASNAPANAYGQQPFLTASDFSTPNEDYFAHADAVLRRAAEKGFLVLLAPAYLGFDGGDEGWYRAMVANGSGKLRNYGQYLGRRYRNYTNILWVQGGDYNPPLKQLTRAIAEGIRDVDTRALHTAHGAPGTGALDYWRGEPWLQVNNVYTYDPVYPAALKQFGRSERMPFFLFESAYENEHRAAEQRLRTQAYHALLSGAAGQIFGNNPIWHFDGPGVFPAPSSWREALASRGAQSMTHLRSLLDMLPWWQLEPDGSVFIRDGAGSGHDRAVAAVATDKSLAIIYVPGLRRLRLDLQRLHGPRISVQWYDPSSGRLTQAAGSPVTTAGLHSIEPEALNSAGLPDWVVLLKSVP